MQAQACTTPKLEWLNPAPSSIALGGLMFEQIIGQRPAVDAVFFCNDDLAQGALLAATRLQVAVPQRGGDGRLQRPDGQRPDAARR